MNTAAPWLRLVELERRLGRLRNRLDPGSNRAEIIELAIAEIDAIERHVSTMEGLHKPKPGKRLEGRPLWESLAIAVQAFTLAKRSARLDTADLWDLVRQHCPPYDLHCEGGWGTRSAPAVVGLLRSEPQVRKLIEGRGIAFWEMWQDEQFRFVDPKWLTAHADIFRWVHIEWDGGRRCRFCACPENERVNALESVNPEFRNGYQMVCDVVVVQVGTALTHEACRKYWVEWTAIAAKYKTAEAAEATDKIAGRQSRWEKVAALEAPVDE
jgi:hypothetical protein